MRISTSSSTPRTISRIASTASRNISARKARDRKSTRLNSSHVSISYAVFCLKKKTSIARPLIAKRMVEIAHREGADAIAHGATGKGNDQVRFELTAAALAPQLEVIAPWRDARFRDEFPGRAEMIAYCARKLIPVQASAKKPYSSDRNLLHISFEAGILEDPWMDAFAPKHKDMFKLSVAPED